MTRGTSRDNESGGEGLSPWELVVLAVVETLVVVALVLIGGKR